MRELKIADVTSILINTKIQKYKKHANILTNIIPGKKTQNENPHFKEFSGISPNIFGIVGAARNKNRSTKKTCQHFVWNIFRKKT